MNGLAANRDRVRRKRMRASLSALVLAFGLLPCPADAGDESAIKGPAASGDADWNRNRGEPERSGAKARTTWSPPSKRRGDWTFELFSPPEIYFDAAAGVYVPADAAASDPVVARSDFGLRLAGLRLEQFPLRLIGHLGEVTEKRGVFEDRDSGEIFVAGTGPLPGREFEIHDLLARADGGAGGAFTAIVQMRDAERVVSLAEGRPGETGRLCAVLEFPDGVARELAAGVGVVVGGVAYRIAEIDAAGLRVRVEREAAGGVGPEAMWIEWSDTEEVETMESEASR